MFKKIYFLIFIFLLFFIFPKQSFASSYVNIVNPVRGSDFWDLKDQQLKDAVLGQLEILKNQEVAATWLLRSDVYTDSNLLNIFKTLPQNQELGIFLEVTPTLANKANVTYQKSDNWHSAESVFLTGYSIDDRKKLIDVSFEEFKNNFGDYPKSVGAWFVDGYSLEYMQQKYKVLVCLIVADQYSTDNYQIWGQYWGAPYYPQKRNTLVPAQSKEDKLSVVVVQWATRDPVNGYGKAVEESTYSVQANDYIDYHELGISYFEKLIDIYTTQKFNQLNQIVVGLENSYDWKKYGDEYKKQIELLKRKQKEGNFRLTTLSEFGNYYLKTFPDFSPRQMIVADDPLGTNKKVVWFMNPYYRAGWFYDYKGSSFKDIRQYLEFQEQLCYDKPCKELNFATSATRVLDEVSFGQKWLLDEGNINEVNFIDKKEKFVVEYKNDAGKNRIIEFLPRDISFEGKITSIDQTILNITAGNLSSEKFRFLPSIDISLKNSPINLVKDLLIFVLYVLVIVFTTGYLILKKLTKIENITEQIFLSLIIGFVIATLLSYVLGFLKVWWVIYIFGLATVFGFFVFRVYKVLIDFFLLKKNVPILVLITLGSIFQVIPTARSGLEFGYGMGFWGPNTHDGVWHLSLINQLLSGLPPNNPVFSGEILKNYHYLFDLTLAASYLLTKIGLEDLLFRFFPFLFSLLLGFGTIIVVKKIFPLFEGKILYLASFFSLFFVYFAGSFGWIVTLIHERVLSGESAFWANQPISFNLNPPFAMSLVIIIASIILLDNLLKSPSQKTALVLGLIIGSLMGFKAYGFILSFISLAVLSIKEIFKGKFFLIESLIFSTFLSLGIYLPNFQYTSNFVFSPFWFIHTMIDFPDRVGWVRLSIGRAAYIERGEWVKFFIVEVLGLILFLFGNLGIRFLGLFSFKKEYLKNPLYIYVVLISFFGFIIPLLFIQIGTPWNTIQFFYYTLYFSSIFAGVTLAKIFFRLPRIFSLILVGMILIVTPINSLATANSYLYKNPHSFISQKELEALNFLSTKPWGVVMTYPYDLEQKRKVEEPYPLFIYGTTAYVSAFSKKPSFLEDEIQNELLSIKYQQRRVESKNFFESRGSLRQPILGKVKYIYLQKYYKINLVEDKDLEKIYENEEISIYSINSL